MWLSCGETHVMAPASGLSHIVTCCVWLTALIPSEGGQPRSSALHSRRDRHISTRRCLNWEMIDM